jgi:glycerate 2-kinase
MSEIARPRAFLVAPDSFKGTFGSAEVARAIGRGLESAGATADLCPAADGGEGTADVLLAARGGDWVMATAHDPLGREITAHWALLSDGRAVVEAAAASGLGLVGEDERDAEAADSAGTGELIATAAAAGVKEILVAAGGSASTDGGAGAIAAIEAAGGLGAARLEVICDVRARFEDAARVFAPQKGATPEGVERLARRLERLAHELPRDPRGIEMTGCAGGLSGGLWARYGATLRPGAQMVLDAVGFDARLSRADACVTGEGRLDAQSISGKLVGEVVRRCSAAGRPVHVLAGEVALPAARLGADSAESATTLAELEAAASRLTDR